MDACAGKNGVATRSVNMEGTNHFFSRESNHVKWIVDIGATNHMIGDHRHLMSGGLLENVGQVNGGQVQLPTGDSTRV